MDNIQRHNVQKHFPLSQVTVASKTKQSFDFINTNVFAEGILQACLQEDVILKQGSSFPVPNDLTVFKEFESINTDVFNDLIVLQCEPLNQGLLQPKTALIIVDDTSSYRSHTKDDIGNTTTIEKQTESKRNNDKNLSIPYVSDFLSVYHLPNSSEVMIPGQLLESIVLQQHDDTYMKVQLKSVTSFSTFQSVIRQSVNYKRSCDIHNTAVIEREFAQTCGLFDGDYVEIKRRSSSSVQSGHKTSQRCHLCQVKVVETVECLSTRDNIQVLYVLPSVFFSLQAEWDQVLDGNMEVQLKRYCQSDQETTNCSVSSGQAPPYATELHLSCVKSPAYNALDSYSDLLQLYFKVPRLVKKRTVLSIHSKDDPAFWQNVTESSERRFPVVYFKVTKVSPKVTGCGTFLADTMHTTLFLDAPVSSFIPSVMSHVMKGDHVTPPGLQDHVTQLLQLFTPYMQGKSGVCRVYPSVLLSGPSGCGKTWLVRSVAAYLNVHCFQINCPDLCGETSGATEARIKHTIQRVENYAPCVLMLCNLDALGKERDGSGEDPRVASVFQEQIASLVPSGGKYPVLLIATTSSYKSVSPDIQECFLHNVQVEVPCESSRVDILKRLFQDCDVRKDISLKHVAQRTAGFVLGDLQALVFEVKKAAYDRITKYCCECVSRAKLSWAEEERISEVGYSLCQADFDQALDRLQAAHSDSLGAPKIPNVHWEDVGGLASVKSDILDTIQLPLQHPELFAEGLRRSGVLLYGPPGTGKTLLAKAVATECSLNFLSVKGPELINMYVGQSEENIREVFHRARSASPCVIFFDELDSLAPNRGRSGDSGGVMDRVVSQLLAELDGLHKSTDVFVIGATNRPDLLDPALLRPGRFDKLLFLGVSEDKLSQLNILKALTRKFDLSGSCSLDSVVSQCPYNMTGADFYALCSDAMLNALKRSIARLEAGEEVDQKQITVEEDDFHRALETLVPSVSVQELQHYRSIQRGLNVHNKKLTIQDDVDSYH